MKKIILLAALLLPAVTLANGYDVPNVAPRDLSLAGSADAAQNDAGAAYSMSAGLARLPGLSLSLNASMLSITTEWTAPAGSGLAPSPETTDFAPVPPVALFASYGFQLGGNRAGVGFGLNVPGGGAVSWDPAWAGRGSVIEVDRKIFGLYLTGGYELLPQLRLGGGLVYYYATEYVKQGIQPFPDAYGELSTSGGAFSFDVSAEFQPIQPLTLAVDYKYKGAMTLKGDGHFQVPPALAASVQDQGVTHELTYPAVLNAAAAWRVAGPVLVTAGFTYTWYEVYQSDIFVGDKGALIEVPFNYGNGSTYRLGVEWAASDQLDLRAGVLRDLSGFKTDYYSPSLPDGDSWAGSLGAGYAFSPNLTANAAFFYAVFDKVTATGESFPGSYQTSAWILSAGITYQRDLAGGGK